MQLTKDEIDALWDSTAEVGSDIGGHHRFAETEVELGRRRGRW